MWGTRNSVPRAPRRFERGQDRTVGDRSLIPSLAVPGKRVAVFGAFAFALGLAVLLPASGALAGDPLGEIATVATGGTTAGFSANTRPRTIAEGPDGNLWFVESEPVPGAIGRITPDGVVTEFAVPGSDFLSLLDITAGPDGAMWFTGFNGPGGVYRVTMGGTVTLVAEGGVTAGFPSGNVQEITAGPDGNLWVTRPSFSGSVADQLVRITPGGAVTGFGGAAGLPDDATLREITVGPDGNLYMTDSGQGAGNPTAANRVWRFNLTSNTFELIATAGTTPGFTAGVFPGDITSGPDGNLWFLFGGPSAGIARLTTAGEVTEFTDGVSADAFLRYVTVGCDGGLWFTQAVEDNSTAAVWRAGTDGTLTPYTAGLPAGSSPEGIAAAPDDNLWFVNSFDPGSVNTIGAGCAAPITPTPAPITPTFTG
jgi:virginiamycin B lyase